MYCIDTCYAAAAFSLFLSTTLEIGSPIIKLITLYNVCAVPWGVLSTVGVFSTVGDIIVL